MSEKFSKEDIRLIAEELVENLRECEDGTVMATADLAREKGYGSMEMTDLFELDKALSQAARKNKITLDRSAYDGIPVGLPFNIPFVVKNRKAQIKCPFCGSVDTARYIYGFPVYSEKMQTMLNNGKWVLGGCLINTQNVNGQQVTVMPARRCNKCRKDFGTPPVLLTKKDGSAEDYRDIIRSISFHIGGFSPYFTEITITKDENGAHVDASDYSSDTVDFKDCHITQEKWCIIVDTLYSKLYLHEWKKRYVDFSVLDGTQWTLEIKLTKGRIRRYYGSNDYPPYWNELKKLFRPFVKITE